MMEVTFKAGLYLNESKASLWRSFPCYIDNAWNGGGRSSVCFSLHDSSTSPNRARVCIAVAVLAGGAGKRPLWQQEWE